MIWKQICFLGEVALIISLYVISYNATIIYRLSFYGLIMILYFSCQMVCSLLNDRDNLRKKNAIDVISDRIILLVVGHRENPDYWRQCLRSINGLTDPISSILVIIDGNETEEDHDMYETANTILDKERVNTRIVMVEKRGKRGAMYFGVGLIRERYSDRDMFVCVTDSDTILEPDCLSILYQCISTDDGCVTGFLDVFNTDHHILPRIINSRYAYAFGIERAAQSYFGCMTCCSGPLSMYRLSLLTDDIMERFVNQTICGVRCEPGDDRHLTNLIMQKGYHSRQTSLAKARTEAPETLIRFLLQQLRWSRSFFRELRWQFNCLPQQSYFLGIIMAYETCFPFFVFLYTLYILFHNPYRETVLYSFYMSITILFLRTIIMMMRFRSFSMVYLLLYYPMYFIFLLPIKIFAAITVHSNGWLTNSRHHLPRCSNDIWIFVFFLSVWITLLFLGCYNLFVVLTHHDVSSSCQSPYWTRPIWVCTPEKFLGTV